MTLLEATGRGRLRLRGEAIGVKIRALGECSIDGGETRVVRATVRAK